MKIFKQLVFLLLISLGTTNVHAGGNKYNQQIGRSANYKKPDLRQQRQVAKRLPSLQNPQRDHHKQLRDENRRNRAINFVRKYKKLDVFQQIAKTNDFAKANKMVVREQKREQRFSKQFGLNDTSTKVLIALVLLPLCLASDVIGVTQKINSTNLRVNVDEHINNVNLGNTSSDISYDVVAQNITASTNATETPFKHTAPIVITATISHALGYCNNNIGCQKLCHCQDHCPTTVNITLCALGHITQANPNLKYSDRLRDTFATVVKRSQMHPEYIEFFHGYDGRYGMLYDVMTEIAQRLYGDPHNPSPLFLRIFSEDFSRGGKNIAHFFKETWDSGLLSHTKDWLGRPAPDHDVRAKALLLATNVALAGNAYDPFWVGECTLRYFLSGQSYGTINIEQQVSRILSKFIFFQPQLLTQITTMYGSPNLNSGQLLQILVPRKMVNDCAYSSKEYGYPSNRELFENPRESISNVLDVLPQRATENFEKVDLLQARLLLNPRYAKHFIVYRYFETPEAEQSSQEARSKLHALFDKEFAQLGNKNIDDLRLIERIYAEEDGAREKGLQRLSELSSDSPLIEPLCNALEFPVKCWIKKIFRF
jgi:hypothetical protein